MDILLIIVIIAGAFLLIALSFRYSKNKYPSGEQKKKITNDRKVQEENRRIILENDIERVTKEDIRKLIVDLDLPQTVLELFDGNCYDEVLRHNYMEKDYAAPYSVIDLTKHQQDAYLIDRYKPILAYAHSTIFAYDVTLKGFICYYIEGNLEKIKPECLTWDGLFISEILRWWENEVNEEDILHIGKLFGLRYIKEVLDSIYFTTQGKGFATFEKAEQWRNSLIDKYNFRIG